MNTQERVTHQFVEFMPDQLEAGTLYISLPFGTITHLCMCGCGEEVQTPLSRTHGWLLGYDGEFVTLFPSIGNWSLPCRSHYWIRRGQVTWASTWSPEEVRQARQEERRWRMRHQRAESVDYLAPWETSMLELPGWSHRPREEE